MYAAKEPRQESRPQTLQNRGWEIDVLHAENYGGRSKRHKRTIKASPKSKSGTLGCHQVYGRIPKKGERKYQNHLLEAKEYKIHSHGECQLCDQQRQPKKCDRSGVHTGWNLHRM